jgi:hypothetical protein
MMLIVAIPLVLVVSLYVVYPLFRGREAVHHLTTDSERRLADLLHQQQMIQNTMDDLEFDVSTGKLSDDDFSSLASDLKKQQNELDAQMKNIVGISSAELTARLEEEIVAYKNGQTTPSLRCPRCGKRLQAGDQFCSSCGNKIA